MIFAGGRTTGSSSGLSGFPTYYWASETWFWIAGTFLVVITALAWLFVRSDMGRVLVAIRENETRCAYLGIPVSRIKILLLVVAGAIGAIAGFGYAAFTNVVAPELAGFLLGTELLIWVALGGRGTLIGPVIGAILIDVTSSYLSGSLPFYWKLLIGILFVVIIVALPQGLMPEVTKLWRRLVRGTRRRRKRRRSSRSLPGKPSAAPSNRSWFATYTGTSAAFRCSRASTSSPTKASF